MATSASVSLFAQPPPANGSSLWRGGGAARAPHPARFASRAAHAPAANAKRRTLQFVSVSGAPRTPSRLCRRCRCASSPTSCSRPTTATSATLSVSPVGTEGEFSAGHPEGTVNIPYMNRTGSGMTKNTHFLEQVSRIFGKDDEIIVGCQSGKRSLMAATELCFAGYTAVTDILGVEGE